MKRWKVWSVVLLVVFVGVLGAGADEPELDPLLKLLVERGLITIEEALAVQAEYDRRRAEEETPTIPTQTPAPAPSPEKVVEPVREIASEDEGEKWYDRFDFRGDLRLRTEIFWVEGISQNDRRGRFRARIRPGIYTDITDWMDVGLQLRSGDPLDPVSDNSTFDGGFSLIPISIS
ncbi:MAG: putative porin [Acidobacteria bacterium]|nr:putative porin [Candidatus Sulfomarinibacter sp. MAG AM2]